MKIILLVVILSILVEKEFADDLQVNEEILQALQTGPLWFEDHTEINAGPPDYLMQEFNDLEMQHSASLPSLHSLYSVEVIQVCQQIGNTTNAAVLQFSVQPFPANPSRLISAELRVYLTPAIQQMGTHFIENQKMIQLYQVVEKQPLTQPDSHRLLTVTFQQAVGYWHSFNVKNAVIDWLTGARPNLGFLLPEIEYVQDESKQPLLVLKYGARKDSSSHQVSFEIQSWHNASSVNFDEVLPISSCKRQPWVLNFTKWGLLAPQVLDVGVCSGMCSFTTLGVAHAAHTAIQSILGTSCCVPAHYKPAPVMFRQQNGNFITKVIPNLVTNFCTCK